MTFKDLQLGEPFRFVHGDDTQELMTKVSAFVYRDSKGWQRKVSPNAAVEPTGA